jgi:AraC-like DNA-binding protein
LPVVLDTSTMPERDRADAVISAMLAASVPSDIRLQDPNSVVASRVEVWNFGVASIFRASTIGIEMVRTAKQALTHPSPDLALAVHEDGLGMLDQCGEQRLIRAGDLHITDLNAPYDFRYAGMAASRCLYVPLGDLGLPAEVIRDAGSRLHTSPVYALMVNHVIELTRRADELSSGPGATSLGIVSVELARALLASAAHDTRYRRDALAATLLTQIRAYIREHISDPDLTPEVIATAHNISVRYLYKLCSAADFSLHRWITSQRLHGARDELGGVAGREHSIAMVARRWGFTNPTHFGRRFREAFGVSPRDWRQISHEAND